jgi:hypothetical protein
MVIILLPIKAELRPTRAKKKALTKLKIEVSRIFLALGKPFTLLRKMMFIPSEQGSKNPMSPNSTGITTIL